MKNSVSIHTLEWDKEKARDLEILTFGEKLKEVIGETRRYKTENALSLKTEMNEVVIKTDEKLKGLFEETINDIKACCRAKNVIITTNYAED